MTGLQYLDIDGKTWAYQLMDDKFLGSGTFGHVHLAQAAIDGTTVHKIAVKTLNIRGTRNDLESELKKKKGENSWKYLFSLNHPNILKYYGVHVTSPAAYSINLLMEYCSGESLDNLLLAKKIPATYIPIYAKQILEGLRYLHEHNPRIAHTDLKPGNIMRHTDYPLGPGNLKICDLDDPIVLKGHSTRIGEIDQCRGSLPYFSPEMAALLASGQLDAKKFRVGRRTDIWSLGCIVLDLVCEIYPQPVTIQIPRSESADSQVRTVERYTVEHENLLKQGGIPFPAFSKYLQGDLGQFLNRCFTFEPKERSTAAELLQDPFFNQLRTVPFELNACPDSFTVDELKQLSVGCCCWTQSAPGAVLQVDLPDIIQDGELQFYLSDLMKGIQVFKELGKKAFIELTIRHLGSQFWAKSAALQTLLQDISTHIVVLRFRRYPGWSSKSLAGLFLPNLLELRFEGCDELRFLNGDFIECRQLRAITLISSTFEVFENFLEQVPKLVFMHFNVQWKEHKINDNMKNRKLKVSRHIRKFCSPEYNWLRSFMNQNPSMAMLKRAGDIWKIGSSENVDFEECFTECLGEDSSHNQRGTSLPLPSFRMDPVSISDREFVQRMVKVLGPGVKVDFGSLEDEGNCLIWSVQCDGKVPSAEFKELCDFLAGLQASHPICLILTDCRPNLVEEVSQLQENICFLDFFFIKKFVSRHIKELVLPNLLQLAWEQCSEVVLTTGSLDGFPNLRAIFMSGTTVKTFYTGVFDKLTQLQLLALWRGYKDVDPGDLWNQLNRFDTSRDFEYTRDFIKMRPWLVEQKHEGEIVNFSSGSSSLTSLPYDACESFLALVFADPSHRQMQLLPSLGLPNLADSQLAPLKNYSITAKMIRKGVVELSFPSYSSTNIGNLKDGIANAAQICRENALQINVTCSELLEKDLLVPLSENVTALFIKTIDNFDGSLLSRIEFPRLIELFFFKCHDLILNNSNFVKMPGLRIINLQYSTIKPPEPSQTIFGDLDNLGWIALHRDLRSRTRKLSGGINWDKCTESERKYILELYTYPEFEGVRQLLKEKSHLTAGYGPGELYRLEHSENSELPADEMFIAEEVESLKSYMAQMVQYASFGLKLPNLIDYQLTDLKQYSITAQMIRDGVVKLSFPNYSSTNIGNLKDGIAAAAQICRENALDINVTCSELLENDMLVPLSENVFHLWIKTIDNFDGSLLSRIEFPRLNQLNFFQCHDLILDNSNFVKMPGLRMIIIQYSTIKPPEPSQTIFGDLDNLGWIALHPGLRRRSRGLSGGINWDKCTEHERKYILELYTYPEFEGVRQLLKEKSHLTAGYGDGELFRLEHSENSELPADEMFTAEEIDSLKLYMAQMVQNASLGLKLHNLIDYQLTHLKKYSITAKMIGGGVMELSFPSHSSKKIGNLKDGIAAAAQICRENALDINVTCSELLENDLLAPLSENVFYLIIHTIDNFDGSLLSRIEFPRLNLLFFFKCHDLILNNSNFVKMPGLRRISLQYSTIKPPDSSQTIFGDLDNLGSIALHHGLRSRLRLSGGINWDKCTERERKYILELYTYPEFEGVRQLLKEKSQLTAGYGHGELYNFGHSANIKLPADEMFTAEEIESLKLYLAQAARDRNDISQLVQGSEGDNLGGTRRRTNFGLMKALGRRLGRML